MQVMFTKTTQTNEEKNLDILTTYNQRYPSIEAISSPFSISVAQVGIIVKERIHLPVCKEPH